MASITSTTTKNLFDKILPTFGNPRIHIPVWDEDQKMFIIDDYESASGHRYYKGIRFCDRLVIVENVGLYHTWTYIDGIELYAFSGTKIKLVQKRDYDKVFRSEAFVRRESEIMMQNYIRGIFKAQNKQMPELQLEAQAREVVNGCFKSFLDNDFNIQLTRIIPQIE